MNSDSPIPDPPALTPKRRRLNLLSIVGIASCCIFFACSGCCFLFAMFVGAKVIDTPEGAVEAASGITDWTLPNGFSGKSGTTANNFLFRFDIARFDHDQGRGLLILGQIQFKPFPGVLKDPQMQEFLKQNIPDLKMIDLDANETRKVTMTIRGGPAEFQIGRGEDRATTTRYRQVIGHFPGKVDNTSLIFQCEEESLTDEQITEFVESIH